MLPIFKHNVAELVKGLFQIFCSKLKISFGFNHGGFSGITIGAMLSKFISEFVQKVELKGCLSYTFSYKGLKTQFLEYIVTSAGGMSE